MGGVSAAVSLKNCDLIPDPRKRGQVSSIGHPMLSRLTTAQFPLAMRYWSPPAIVTLAAMAALMAVTADAVAQQTRPASSPKQHARPAPTKEAVAPRDAGEP